ncbi:hypothetical protein PRO82_000161 [Candidatus Protochlamydia amoebophila]|nr:hypothetical protein [Candidatus Protochlamydia amoebophila]
MNRKFEEMTLFPSAVINFYLIKNADGQNYFSKRGL